MVSHLAEIIWNDMDGQKENEIVKELFSFNL